MFLPGDGFAASATVVLGVGTSLVGTVGAGLELASKNINQEKHPILRTIGEVFSRTLQNASAAFLLFIIGSLSTNPIVPIALGTIGAVMVLSPIINGLVQYTNHEKIKEMAFYLDKGTSAISKTVNTAILTGGIYMALGLPAAILGGIGIGALNIVAFKK